MIDVDSGHGLAQHVHLRFDAGELRAGRGVLRGRLDLGNAVSERRLSAQSHVYNGEAGAEAGLLVAQLRHLRQCIGANAFDCFSCVDAA